jgi:hypothetical protein
MVDRLAARHSARRRPRRGPDRISDPVAEDRRSAPSETACALEIIRAQYDRELARAARGNPAERAAALAEARRLVKVAVALRGRLTDQHVARIQSACARGPPRARLRGPLVTAISYEPISL